MEKVTLASSNLQRSISYWKDILNLNVFEQKEKSVILGFAKEQAKLELEDIGKNLFKKIRKKVFYLPGSWVESTFYPRIRLK